MKRRCWLQLTGIVAAGLFLKTATDECSLLTLRAPTIENALVNEAIRQVDSAEP